MGLDWHSQTYTTITQARITSLEIDNDVAERRDDTLQPERRDDTLEPGPSERKEKTLHVKRALLPNANDTITIAVFAESFGFQVVFPKKS